MTAWPLLPASVIRDGSDAPTPGRRRAPPPLATRPVTLQAGYPGHVAGPCGGQRAIFTAEGTLSRDDGGLTWNMPLDGGGLPVSKGIRIEIGLEAVLQP